MQKVTGEQLNKVIDDCDKNGDGEIDYN